MEKATIKETQQLFEKWKKVAVPDKWILKLLFKNSDRDERAVVYSWPSDRYSEIILNTHDDIKHRALYGVEETLLHEMSHITMLPVARLVDVMHIGKSERNAIGEMIEDVCSEFARQMIRAYTAGYDQGTKTEQQS